MTVAVVHTFSGDARNSGIVVMAFLVASLPLTLVGCDGGAAVVLSVMGRESGGVVMVVVVVLLLLIIVCTLLL